MMPLSNVDLDFIVRECGGLWAARNYCERISRVNGPLSGQYRDAVLRLNARIRADAGNYADELIESLDVEGKS